MKPPGPPPRVAVAVRCSCGRRIVLEPRWVGKPTGCAGCGREFRVTMIHDPAASRWRPTVSYTPSVAPEKIKQGPDGRPAWINVQCECGHKIGLDSRFLGRNMTCNACGREFIVKTVSKGGHDTAVIRYKEKREATAEIVEPEPAKAAPPKPAARSKAKAASEADRMPEPPSEFHLLCTCGEELVVEREFYDEKMYCAGCGALMELTLAYHPNRGKYQLEARFLEGPQD